MDAANESRLPDRKKVVPISGDAFYAIADYAAHGVALCDARGFCRYTNPAFQRLTGYGAHELYSTPLKELLHLQSADISPDNKEKLFLIYRRDGTYLSVSGFFLSLENTRNGPWLVQIKPTMSSSDAQVQRGHWMHMTQRLAAEAAGVGTWELDMQTEVCTICPVTASILGLSAGCIRLLEKEWKAMIVPEDLPLIEQTKEAALQGEGSFYVEFRHGSEDGRIVWLSVRGMLQSDPQGRPIRAIGIMLDITRHKQIEEQEKERVVEAKAAAEANAKYRAFFYGSSNYAGLLDLDGTLLEANHLSLSACGYAEEQVLGRKFWQCGWWSRSRRIREQIRRACSKAASGQVFRREMVYFIADGSARMTDLTLSPVLDDRGQPLYIAATGADITDRKKAEAALRASEQRYRVLTEVSPDAIMVERQGEIIYANSSAAKLFGASRVSQLLGVHSLNLVPPEFHKLIIEKHATLEGENPSSALLEIRIRRLDGKEVETQAACGKVLWEGESAIQMVVRDVSELKKAEERLRRVSERLRIAIEGTGEGVWDWDIRTNHFTFTGGLNRILGEGDVTRGEGDIWKRQIHPDDLERVMKTFQDAMEEKVPIYECEYRLRDREGGWRWIWARGVIVERDEQGRAVGMAGTLADITLRKKSDELAWRHANLDTLTGLPNRRLFRERLDMELARLNRTGFSLALLFIDLDGFKHVNDTCGHDVGDLLLMEVAHRLKSCVRQTDMIARLGGDEFTLILAELEDLGHVEFVCQELLTILAKPFHLGKDVAYISGSIGVALYPLDATYADDLMRKADQAMYAAKYSGKNQFHYFTKEMDDKAHFRLQITNELRQALNGNQLVVHYQPVLDLRSGQMVKAEALLRWTHPVLGYIAPAEFIPLAEEAGLIQTLGNWVFREAALCCKRCSEGKGQPFQIGVNKSPMQFTSRGAESNWLQYLQEIGLSGSSMSVEITEGVLLRSTAAVIEKLLHYREAGVELALDDFGTGYSSMAYLHKFHIDYVKIDQSFVAGLAGDDSSRTIAEAIITMAHKLGKKVIAEGIETREQLEILLEAGCDYGQGFLFSEAVPADQLLAMIGHNKQLMSAGLSHA